jgi:hypothetical protein
LESWIAGICVILIRSCEDKRADLDSGRVSKLGEVSTDTVLAFEYATTAKVRFGWWLVEFPSILNPLVPLSVYLRISVTVGSLVSASHGDHGGSPCRVSADETSRIPGTLRIGVYEIPFYSAECVRHLFRRRSECIRHDQPERVRNESAPRKALLVGSSRSIALGCPESISSDEALRRWCDRRGCAK